MTTSPPLPPAPPPEVRPVVVVGAGPAGLAVAGALARRGVRATVLEAGEAVGSSWRRHYPFLRLHTTRRDSSLPGWPRSGRGDRYSGRDELVRPRHLVPLEMGAVNWRTWYRAVPGLVSIAGRLGGPPLRRLAPRAAAALWCAVQRSRFGDLERSGLRLQRPDELTAHWRARR